MNHNTRDRGERTNQQVDRFENEGGSTEWRAGERQEGGRDRSDRYGHRRGYDRSREFERGNYEDEGDSGRFRGGYADQGYWEGPRYADSARHEDSHRFEGRGDGNRHGYGRGMGDEGQRFGGMRSHGRDEGYGSRDRFDTGRMGGDRYRGGSFSGGAMSSGYRDRFGGFGSSDDYSQSYGGQGYGGQGYGGQGYGGQGGSRGYDTSSYGSRDQSWGNDRDYDRWSSRQGRDHGYGSEGYGQSGFGSQQYGADRGYGMQNQSFGRGRGFQGNQSGQAYGGGASQDYERNAGPHQGRGPKGWRRSDERIREEVCECIADNGWVDASDVEVRVQDGEVTLTGSVGQRRFKRQLEDLIERVPGVQDVKNELRVKRDDQNNDTTSESSTSGSSATMSSNASTSGAGQANDLSKSSRNQRHS